ncbi:MAG: polysaccharide biosynthesis/export family protein [Candidatus Omnitrophota bacterium]
MAPNFEYRIGDFDNLEIKVWEGAMTPVAKKEEEAKEHREYRISRGDTLNIYVWQWADLNRDIIVRPDGRISFPLVGDILAEGLTLTELDDLMTEKLKAYIKYPEVSIMVMDFGQSGFGSSKILEQLPQKIIVRPDGRISFPFVGEIMARGLTLPELDDKLTIELAKFIVSPEVYINLAQIGGKRVIVLGEVHSPGVFKPQDNARILDVIALAGGYTKDAALGTVILIRGGLSDPRPEKINLANIMKRGDLRQNVYIQPEDIVFVPKNIVADVNYILEQLLGPLKSSGAATTSIKTIRERATPFLATGTVGR